MLLGTIAIAILVIYRLSIKDWAFLILTPSILTLIFYWLIGRRKKEFFDKRIFLVIWLFFLLTILSNPVSAILSGGGDESYHEGKFIGFGITAAFIVILSLFFLVPEKNKKWLEDNAPTIYLGILAGILLIVCILEWAVRIFIK